MSVHTPTRRRLIFVSALAAFVLLGFLLDRRFAVPVQGPGRRTGLMIPERPGPGDEPFYRTPMSPRFEDRRAAFLARVRATPAPAGRRSVWAEIVRLASGEKSVRDESLQAALKFVNERRDPSDFDLAGLTRLYYLWTDKGVLGPNRELAIRQAMRGFKYWFDEPNTTGVEMWTENHQMLCASSEYLAGQLMPDEIFSNNGKSGRWHIQAARARILRWIDWHARTGFAEWDSTVYYPEDLAALFNLADFAEDRRVATLAAMTIDMMLFDIAVDSWHGQFATSHGRATSPGIKSMAHDSLVTLQAVAWGLGRFQSIDNMAAVALITSPRYHVPPAIEAVAQSAPDELLNFERQSIGWDEQTVRRYGLRFDRLDDVHVFWGMGAFSSPEVINLTIDAFKAWDLWHYQELTLPRAVVETLRNLRLLPLTSRLLNPDSNGALLSEVDNVTFRTEEYQLSTAQDYRKGEKGYQQHIWQATLGPYANVFTTNPDALTEDDLHRPSYWMSNGRLPRAAQYRNVAVVLYKLGRYRGVQPFESHHYEFTHAYFPRWAFDELHEERRQGGGWVFGRKGDAYVGLYSRQPFYWTTEGPDADQEIVAPGRENVWICVLGRKNSDGSFVEFTRKAAASAVGGSGLDVDYDAPGVGRLRFGWNGDFTVSGKVVPLRGYPRWDNPFTHVEFGSRAFAMRCGGSTLTLDFAKALRQDVATAQ